MPPAPPSPQITSPPPLPCISPSGQCGGLKWTGLRSCCSTATQPASCFVKDETYSQCRTSCPGEGWACHDSMPLSPVALVLPLLTFVPLPLPLLPPPSPLPPPPLRKRATLESDSTTPMHPPATLPHNVVLFPPNPPAPPKFSPYGKLPSLMPLGVLQPPPPPFWKQSNLDALPPHPPAAVPHNLVLFPPNPPAPPKFSPYAAKPSLMHVGFVHPPSSIAPEPVLPSPSLPAPPTVNASTTSLKRQHIVPMKTPLETLGVHVEDAIDGLESKLIERFQMESDEEKQQLLSFSMVGLALMFLGLLLLGTWQCVRAWRHHKDQRRLETTLRSLRTLGPLRPADDDDDTVSIIGGQEAPTREDRDDVESMISVGPARGHANLRTLQSRQAYAGAMKREESLRRPLAT